MKLNIDERTFGMELEFGDVRKSNVELPIGYGWSPEERSIVNTDARKSTPSGDLGGELNTRPLKPRRSDVRELRTIIGRCFDNGGVLMWNTGFDGHLFIGDLELEDLKKVFALGFFVSPLLNSVFKLGEWFNVEHLVPTPTFEIYERVMAANSIDALKNVFANSSNRGHYRFQINIMAYFSTKTLEFRIFNGSKNFRDTLETIKFMYSFVDFALTKSELDFKSIKNEGDFYRVFGIKRPFAASPSPLIFAESHKEASRNIARGFPVSKKITSAIMNDTGDKLSLVNPFNYSLELALYKAKQLTIFNNSEFNHIVYMICVLGHEISYENHFEILNGFKDGTRQTELSLFYIFSRIQKYNMDTDYGMNEFLAYAAKVDESLEKMKPSVDALVEMLAGVEYIEGTLDDAIDMGGTIVYQQAANSKANSAVTALKKHSDYSYIMEHGKMSYKAIEAKALMVDKLLVVSQNEFLPFVKIARDLNVTLYSTRKSYLGVRQVVDVGESISIKVPPDDLVVDMDMDVQINEVKPTFFSVLQNKFVKRVSKFKQPRICYTISSGDMILGAFGFDYSKGNDYSLFLLSDFCTNNDVRLLSKFILFVIKTREAKRMIERKLVERVSTGYTKVYTTQPVSMKYRGAFKKVKTEGGKSLTYEFSFGDIESIDAAKREFIKRRKG